MLYKKKFQIICVGSSSKDIFFPTEEGLVFDTPEDIMAQKKISFELGAKYQIEKIFEVPGGCAANVAQGLSRLGLKVACYTRIGKDEIGKWIKKELKKEKVDISLIQEDKDCKSDLSAIIVDKKSNDHIVLFNRDANTKLEIIPHKIKNTQKIFVSALNGEWEKHIDAILKVAKSNNIGIIFNPGQRNIKDNSKKTLEIIKNSQVVILNKDEAIEIILGYDNNSENKKLNDEIFLLEKIRSFNDGTVVLTDGERGSWAINEEGIFFSRIVVNEIVDTLGAGDSFTSGFLAGYVGGEGIENSLKMGMANSSNVILFYGAKEGLLNKINIEKAIEKIEVTKLS